MKVYGRSLNPHLLSFWYEHAAVGRIGLVHIDIVTARLIGWAERRVTPDGEPSPWAHVFVFLKPRSGVPWIAESDLNVPLPGFRPKPNGPQENPIYKWSHPAVDHAVVLDPALQDHQLIQFEEGVRQILRAGYTYRVGELAEAWVAMRKHDLRYRGRLHRDDAMHCGHFVRDCLRGAGCDPLGPGVLPENTVPDLIAHAFPVVAEWHAAQPESEDAGA
jgi:hypothetical protein